MITTEDTEEYVKKGLDKCKIIELPKITDRRGNLTFIEEDRHIPFRIKRVFYFYDVPTGATRGGHAHWKTEQFMIALSGSFEIILDDGHKRKTVFLNRPHYGLYIPPEVWREMANFSSDSVALVLASTYYKAEDYIRDYKEFKRFIKNNDKIGYE